MSWYFRKWMYGFDVALACLLTAIPFVLLRQHDCPIWGLLDKDGTAMYGAFLSALAALLGFAIAAVAITASLVSTPRFLRLRASDQYQNFWRAFLWSIRALAVATAIALVAMFANKYEAARYGTLFASILAILIAAASLLRSGLTLEAVLKATNEEQRTAVTTEVTRPQRDVAP